MSNVPIQKQIETLLSKINEQHHGWKNKGETMPKIEQDIMLSHIRNLYEMYSRLDKQEYPVVEIIPEKSNLIKETNPTLSSLIPPTLFDEKSTIADKYLGETPTFHDEISKKDSGRNLAGTFKKKPIHDLKTAIGINEKFLIVNELFDGNVDEFNNSLLSVNHFTTYAEAFNFFKNNFHEKYKWNTRNQNVKNDFLELIERRFL